MLPSINPADDEQAHDLMLPEWNLASTPQETIFEEEADWEPLSFDDFEQGLVIDLDTPTDELRLVDARFLARPELDAAGTTTGYLVQCTELYQNVNGLHSGRVLDVARYDDSAQANQVYQMLQDSITSGELAVNEVGGAAEQIAEANDLPSDQWRDMTPDDGMAYASHSQSADPPDPDVPPEEWLNDPAFTQNVFTASTLNSHELASEQDRLANQQAIAALREIGLEPPADFNVRRDSFYDPETGERGINGIFMRDPDDPSQACRPIMVALNPGAEGLGVQADAVEFGDVGSLQQAQALHDEVQAALEQGGISQAVQTIDGIETERLDRDLSDPVPNATTPEWLMDID